MRFHTGVRLNSILLSVVIVRSLLNVVLGHVILENFASGGWGLSSTQIDCREQKCVMIFAKQNSKIVFGSDNLEDLTPPNAAAAGFLPTPPTPINPMRATSMGVLLNRERGCVYSERG